MLCALLSVMALPLIGSLRPGQFTDIIYLPRWPFGLAIQKSPRSYRERRPQPQGPNVLVILDSSQRAGRRRGPQPRPHLAP